MSFEFFISLRYLRARRKQVFVSIITIISMVGISLGVATLIIVLAVMSGFETNLRDKILGINSHIVLTEYSGTMRNYREVMKDCTRVDGVMAATPFIYGQAMLKNGGSVSGVVLKGLAMEEGALKVISLGRMKEGNINYLLEKHRGNLSLDRNMAGLPGIIVGKELAKNLGIFLFDAVSLISPTGVPTPMGMMPRIKKFLVVGIFDSGFYEYDSTLTCLSLKDCQEFLNMDYRVTGVEIRVKDIYKADAIAKAMERKLGYPYLARNWMEMNKNLFSALQLEKRVMFIILSLIVLVAAFNIISILTMVVMEKNREIAVLKSMGATSKSIMKIFILQGLTIGTIGTSLGCFLGISVALNIEKLSHIVENVFKFKILPPDIYYLSELPSKVNYGDVSVIAMGTMLICFLSTLYPSWSASRLDPVEALRYE
ncbi:MAG: lipoprotein-releasing ABC transporter permease subunit [Syntrophales bacterium]|nr:lipoprotein-releasing ABC transporter permease subunit [Syntrophales bacterium]